MKALITGAGGQVGRALAATAPHHVVLSTFDRAALDLTDGGAVGTYLQSERPDLVINAAAWTAVDAAETNEDAARAINADAVATLSAAARDCGARFVHISTDFVFDGRSSTPYPVDAQTAPASAYGRTKLAGEIAAGGDALIVRTAWVYAARGGNFVRTMLRLMVERPEVRVVSDQVGTPTYASSLAAALWALAETDVRGIQHFTDAGVASWFDFSVAIQEEALTLGLLERAVPIVPIATADYPTPARRPAYSVLDKSASWALLGAPSRHWRIELRDMLKEIRDNG